MMFRSAGKRRCFWACCALASCMAAAAGVSKDHIVEGWMVHTAEGNGRWRSWSNTGNTRLRAANKDYIWFSAGGMFWRYNIAEKKVDVWTPPLKQKHLDGFAALSKGGRFAISSSGTFLLWDTRRWRRLPRPAGVGSNITPAFDEKENLWATDDHWVSRWEGDRWRLFQKKPRGSLWNLDGRWYLQYSGSFEKNWTIRHSIWDAALKEHRDINPENDIQYLYIRFYAAGGWYGRGNRKNKSMDYGTLFKITTEGIIPKAENDYLGLDLSTGESFTYQPPEEAGGKVLIQSSEGKVIARLPAWPEKLPRRLSQYSTTHEMLLRDGNGHYWLRHWRCDGAQWRPMVPPGSFEYYGSMRQAIRQGRLQYDSKTETWRDIYPELPTDVYLFDPKTRTGWMKTPRKDKKMAFFSRGYQKCRFAADGTPEVLETVNPSEKRDYGWWPVFESRGNVWFEGCMYMYRWDGKKVHAYRNGYSPYTSGGFMQERPALIHSSAGRVWMCHAHSGWGRFDAEKNTFVKDNPCEDFKTRMGEKTLAFLGWPSGLSDSSAGKIWEYQAKDQKWLPLFNDLIGGDRQERTLDRFYWFGVPGRSVRGDRQLLCCWPGVFELNFKTGRYAYLAPLWRYRAYFDKQGRRVLVSPEREGKILMYEGEPFGQPKRGMARETFEKTLQKHIQAMDNDRWAVREQATRAVMAMATENPDLVKAFFNNPERLGGASPEVKNRVQLILGDIEEYLSRVTMWKVRRPRMVSRTGNSLLERMHPPLPTEGKYLLTVGMDIQHAQAILAAACPFNHFSCYPSIPRDYHFFLPGQRVLFIRVENKDGTGKIVSMGLGGLKYLRSDGAWNYDDPKLNNLKQIKLKPNTAFWYRDR